jgi:hypothetical protein
MASNNKRIKLLGVSPAFTPIDVSDSTVVTGYYSTGKDGYNEYCFSPLSLGVRMGCGYSSANNAYNYSTFGDSNIPLSGVAMRFSTLEQAGMDYIPGATSANIGVGNTYAADILDPACATDTTRCGGTLNQCTIKLLGSNPYLLKDCTSTDCISLVGRLNAYGVMSVPNGAAWTPESGGSYKTTVGWTIGNAMGDGLCCNSKGIVGPGKCACKYQDSTPHCSGPAVPAGALKNGDIITISAPGLGESYSATGSWARTYNCTGFSVGSVGQTIPFLNTNAAHTLQILSVKDYPTKNDPVMLKNLTSGMYLSTCPGPGSPDFPYVSYITEGAIPGKIYLTNTDSALDYPIANTEINIRTDYGLLGIGADTVYADYNSGGRLLTWDPSRQSAGKNFYVTMVKRA